ncbi:class I SAM-dependent methyltransferase [Jannaschia sp. S6380]|uniref:class I SAM-dependent methyltransferase n=1 Tax=Jannaschia sp. S6380 TaxID=2926408 RepID=UPI001FF3D633|nr:class I SAM-dependent methyltransferase [Jannaschia sp. S6380]MCK0169280.1 class I SAM-dependent methyltransferase [Jannaschia sp. S6380]
MSTEPADPLTLRYDAASTLWADKMRLLGYYDAYLGFLSHWAGRAADIRSVADVGAGTGAMAEAWTAVNGPDVDLTLIDPSASMLASGAFALGRRGIEVRRIAAPLSPLMVAPQDAVLAAHVIEHFADPVAALRDMATLLRPGGQLWLVVSKPHWCNAIIWLQWRHRTYDPDRVARLLDAAGFDLEDGYAFPSGPPSRTSRGYLARKRSG